MFSLFCQLRVKCASSSIARKFSVSRTNHKTHSCKLLIVGGGTGGCTIAAKFARRLPKGSVIVLEPSTEHYYQPLFTLVGAGVTPVSTSRRREEDVLPLDATWIRDAAECVDADNCSVRTVRGHDINYEYIVIAAGLENDYSKIPGLYESLEDPDSGVSTIFSHEYCEKTWADLKRFKGGDALFTYPDTPIKCPGAPQKIAYLTDTYLTKKNVRSSSRIAYNTALPVIFGVKKYADELLKVAERKGIEVNYKTLLTEIRPGCKEAVFCVKDESQKEITMRYDLLHVSPPMRPPAFIGDSAGLADPAGFLKVDKFTLQHHKYKNMYGIGDCINTPNSKTAAAIAKQCYVLEHNLLRTMADDCPQHKYDGYGACPLVTSYNTCIMAEFLYDGVVHETFPFNQAKERVITYYMKRDLFPFIYWNFMMKGYYHGPEFVRNIINPFGK